VVDVRLHTERQASHEYRVSGAGITSPKPECLSEVVVAGEGLDRVEEWLSGPHQRHAGNATGSRTAEGTAAAFAQIVTEAAKDDLMRHTWIAVWIK
jgi:hypothetical protein